MQALGKLKRAFGGATTLDKRDREKSSDDASVEDLDKLFPQETYLDMNAKFLKAYGHNYPPVFTPSPQTDARSLREFNKLAFTPRPLKRVGNLYQWNLRPEAKTTQETLGGFTISVQKPEVYEDAVSSMIDALARCWLLLHSFVRVSLMKPYKNLSGKTETWFTLSDAHNHYGWLWTKATSHRITSVEDFLAKEQEMRVRALGDMMDGERLSLSKALLKARSEAGETWQGFSIYSEPGTSPLGVNPLKRQGQALSGAAAKASKFSDIGVQRASNRKERTPDGKPANLKKGNQASSGAIALEDGRRGTLCTDFRTGVGCDQWPCGGIHACDVLVGAQALKPCLGPHSRYNCPHNK